MSRMREKERFLPIRVRKYGIELFDSARGDLPIYNASEEAPMTLQGMKLAIISAVLLVAFSVFYYFVIHLPQRDSALLKLQKEEQAAKELREAQGRVDREIKEAQERLAREKEAQERAEQRDEERARSAQTELARQQRERRESERRADNQLLFEKCLLDAEGTFLKMEGYLIARGEECLRMTNPAQSMGCIKGNQDGFDLNDRRYREAKNECFRKYPANVR